MKLGKLHYSFVIVLAIIAVFCGSKITTSAASIDETRFAFVDRVGEFFGLRTTTVFSNAQETSSKTRVVASEVSLAGVPVAVSMPTLSASPGALVIVPVTTGDVTGRNVISYDFNVDYNPAVLQPAGGPSCSGSACFDTAGTISSTMSITPNATFSGHLIITAFQAANLAGAGTLINLRFNVVGTATAGQTSPLAFADYTDPNTLFHPAFVYNEGDPPSTATNGLFTVAGSTPTSTNTNTPTPSATNTFTPTNTPTDTPTSTATNTNTPTNTATNTPSASPTGTPPPTLGVYPPTSVALSDNVTITPDVPPTMTTGISVSTSTNFIGELTADPVTGVVSVTNAHHANISPGTYAVTVTAFGPGGTALTTFALTVTNGNFCFGFPGIT